MDGTSWCDCTVGSCQIRSPEKLQKYRSPRKRRTCDDQGSSYMQVSEYLFLGIYESMPNQVRQFKAEFFKALAHPLRISILDALRQGERTVAELSQQFEVEQANASQQLAVLRHKNIIVARKAGANVYYSVRDPLIFKLLDMARDIFNSHLAGVRTMLEEMKAEGRRRRS